MPKIFMIAGPNGAGKTTSAIDLLPEILHCEEYVNADTIASALSPFHPAEIAFQAGRLMLERIHQLAGAKHDFAFETTGASRSFLPFLKQCKRTGYTLNLLFLWLHSPELALERVASRVQNGGHHIPDPVVKRRYHKGINNFFELYLPIADSWFFYDNSSIKPEKIAECEKNRDIIVHKPNIWVRYQEEMI